MESGAVTAIRPVGILSPSRADRGQAIRGVAVLGDLDDLESVVADLAERGPTSPVSYLTPTVLAPEARPEGVLMRARRLGLATNRCRRSIRAAKRYVWRQSMSKTCCCGRA